jgi:hypothetical protein
LPLPLEPPLLLPEPSLLLQPATARHSPMAATPNTLWIANELPYEFFMK